jgi:hypothetical protein
LPAGRAPRRDRCGVIDEEIFTGPLGRAGFRQLGQAFSLRIDVVLRTLKCSTAHCAANAGRQLRRSRRSRSWENILHNRKVWAAASRACLHPLSVRRSVGVPLFRSMLPHDHAVLKLDDQSCWSEAGIFMHQRLVLVRQS